MAGLKNVASTGAALLRRLNLFGDVPRETLSPRLDALLARRAEKEAMSEAEHMAGTQYVEPGEVAEIRRNQPTTMLQHVSPHILPGRYGLDPKRFGTGEGAEAYGPGFYTTIEEGANPVSSTYERYFQRRPGSFVTEQGPLRSNPKTPPERTPEYVAATQPARQAASAALQEQGGLPMHSFNLFRDYIKAAQTGIGAEEYLVGLKMKGVPDAELVSIASAIDKLPAGFGFKPVKSNRYDILLTDDINKAVDLDRIMGEQAPAVGEALKRVEAKIPGAGNVLMMPKTGGYWSGARNLTAEGVTPNVERMLRIQNPGRVMTQAEALTAPTASSHNVFSNAPTGEWTPEMRRRLMAEEGIVGGIYNAGNVLPDVDRSGWVKEYRNFLGYDPDKLLIIRRHGVKGALAAGAISAAEAEQLTNMGAPMEPEEM